jgi:hypothetical protein
MHKKTKIICTLGPASENIKTIEQMVRAGMNVARLNFSHGDHENHKLLIDNIRRVSAKVGVPIAIIQDLHGPKIRIKAEKVITFQREDPNFDNLLIKNLGITKEKYPKIFEILNFYSEDGPIIFFRDMLKYSCQYSTSENVDFQKCKKEINKIKTENQWYADLIYYIKKYDISISVNFPFISSENPKTIPNITIATNT